ncbi:unnamed protein product [Pedinophyceae sp. YPF-701]|nr:unnamed protein product [Pedinophyceae sp. YPF-701]
MSRQRRGAWATLLALLLCASLVLRGGADAADGVIAGAAGATGAARALVVLGTAKQRATYSAFLTMLAEVQSSVEVVEASEGFSLMKYGDRQYDNVVILAPRVSSFASPDVSARGLTAFLEKGGNVFITADHGFSSPIQSITSALGVGLDEKGAIAVDHTSHNATLAPSTPSKKADRGPSALLATTGVYPTQALLEEPLAAPVLFRGVCSVLPAQSDTLLPALWAEDTGYSFREGRSHARRAPVAGQLCSLATLVQARNNARAVVLGSTDMLSNTVMGSPVEVPGRGRWDAPGNARLARALAEWAFQRNGVLRMTRFDHVVTNRPGVPRNPEQYRVSDDVTLTVRMERLVSGQWQPYASDAVQASFVMLDPYVRRTLSHDGKGNFKLEFKVPDVYGVFKYVVRHRDPGFSAVDLEHVQGVRPFRHDEYPRFLTQAYPYYTAAFSMIGAFLAMTSVMLYHK